MKPLSLTELRSVTNGRPLTAPSSPGGAGDDFIRAITTDSRQLSPGCLFIALKGDTHDGHDFVPGLTREQGVVAVLVEREGVALPPSSASVYVLLVPSTKAAMGRLASHVRAQVSGSVIAVGGSNGKTSTKHLIDAALRAKLRGSISPKSFNNDIGVPLTIFNHDPNFDFIVLEVGTNHHGELKVLSDMTSPDVAVITSISHEHLEGLSDLNGVRREEASIISGLKPDGLLVVNGDDPELMPHLAPWKGKRVTFGFGPHNDLFATDVRVSAHGTTFHLNGSRREVFVPILGVHTATNALAALAVARRLFVDEDQAIEALAHATGPEMRQQLVQVSGITVLNDAYNANPASMRSAFQTFLALPLGQTGRRLAVLGDMREMGDASDDLHRQLGQDAAQLGMDLLLFVGRQAKLAHEAAVASGLNPATTLHFPDAASAGVYLRDAASAGDLLLLKGSRGVKLESILPYLAPATQRRIA